MVRQHNAFVFVSFFINVFYGHHDRIGCKTFIYTGIDEIMMLLQLMALLDPPMTDLCFSQEAFSGNF